MPRLPFSHWLPEYKTPGTIRADLLAGLTGAVVVLPQGIAFAMLAGMPPQYGLYAAMVPCLIAALFGSSRLMVTGPANAISLTTMALIAPLATPESAEYVGLVLTLSFLIGLIQITLGFSGVGKWVQKVPHSVIVGFTVGAAILIMNSQIGTVTGFAIPRGISPHETVYELYMALRQNSWHPEVMGLVIATILIIVIWRPLNRWFPGMLVAVIIGSLIALYIESLYPELTPFKRVSSIPGAIPVFSLPHLDMNTLNQLFGATLIMALLASTEAMAIARAMAIKTKDTFNANQEFIGQGLANIAGSFFSAYPSSGSFNRSGVNLSAGAKTPLSAISAALFLVIILTFVGPLAKYLPYPVIGALLLVVAWNLIDPKEIRNEFHHGIKEWLPMVITFIGTVTISLEWAILAGIFASILCHHLYKAKKSH